MARNVFTAGRGINALDLTRLGDAIAQTYYFPTGAGGAVTVSSGMTVAVSAITVSTVYINGSVVGTGYAGGTVTLAASDPTNPRIDSIYYDTSGAVDDATGTAVAVTSTTGPVPPTLSSTQIRLADIYVAAGATSIASGDITDRRQVAIAAETFFNSERTAFRANRRLVAAWASPGVGANAIGFQSASGGSSSTAISGEPIWLQTGTGTFRLTGVNGVAALSPNHSPRMLCRLQFPAASANVTFLNIGFMDTPSATANGAYLRVVTTGNVFFVTRQGGSETATDLGALSRTTILGFEIETADAGVTWVCRNQAGTQLASHTTNVPTAATGLNYGFESSIATAGVSHGISYMVIEGTFA